MDYHVMWQLIIVELYYHNLTWKKKDQKNCNFSIQYYGTPTYQAGVPYYYQPSAPYYAYEVAGYNQNSCIIMWPTCRNYLMAKTWVKFLRCCNLILRIYDSWDWIWFKNQK